MIPILSLTHQTFADQVHALLGRGRIHARLVYEEFFRHGAIHGLNPAFNNAQTLLKEILAVVDLTPPTIIAEKNDGTTGKILIATHDQLEVESVLIPMQAGGTLCISSQVGCRMGCTFCETGRMGLLRHLTASEIISQAFAARHQLGFKFRNIVFMGMGEPFDNYEAVMQAVRVLRDPHGFGLGRKQITISTSGCIEGIERLTVEGKDAPNLAVSINAPNDALRTKLMPVNRKHCMQELYLALQRYCAVTGREILTAYVLLDGINDSVEHAHQLADYLHGLSVKINLIPYNPQAIDRFKAPQPETVMKFAACLRERGLYTLVRATKGQQIMAACGQLGNRKHKSKIPSCSP